MMPSGPSPPHAGPFGRFLDAHVHDPPEGWGLEVRMEVDARHENAGATLHGGVQMSLLDMAMGGAVAKTLAPDERAASITINTDFLRPGAHGVVVARGRVDRRGATAAFASGELLGPDGKVIARATGIWAVRKA